MAKTKMTREQLIQNLSRDSLDIDGLAGYGTFHKIWDSKELRAARDIEVEGGSPPISEILKAASLERFYFGLFKGLMSELDAYKNMPEETQNTRAEQAGKFFNRAVIDAIKILEGKIQV